MSGVNGNDNHLYIRQHHFLTMDGSSDQTIAFLPQTKVVRLYATAAAWVQFGTNPTAASVAEKTASAPGAFYVPAAMFMDVPIPVSGTPAAPIKMAALQGASGGTIHVYELSEV